MRGKRRQECSFGGAAPRPRRSGGRRPRASPDPQRGRGTGGGRGRSRESGKRRRGGDREAVLCRGAQPPTKEAKPGATGSARNGRSRPAATAARAAEPAGEAAARHESEQRQSHEARTEAARTQGASRARSGEDRRDGRRPSTQKSARPQGRAQNGTKQRRSGQPQKRTRPEERGAEKRGDNKRNTPKAELPAEGARPPAEAHPQRHASVKPRALASRRRAPPNRTTRRTQRGRRRGACAVCYNERARRGDVVGSLGGAAPRPAAATREDFRPHRQQPGASAARFCRRVSGGKAGKREAGGGRRAGRGASPDRREPSIFADTYRPQPFPRKTSVVAARST